MLQLQGQQILSHTVELRHFVGSLSSRRLGRDGGPVLLDELLDEGEGSVVGGGSGAVEGRPALTVGDHHTGSGKVQKSLHDGRQSVQTSDVQGELLFGGVNDRSGSRELRHALDGAFGVAVLAAIEKAALGIRRWRGHHLRHLLETLGGPREEHVVDGRKAGRL